jgi:hypothetical protein
MVKVPCCKGKTPFGRKRSFFSSIGKRLDKAAGWLNRTLDSFGVKEKAYDRMADVLQGVRMDYSPPVRAFLEDKGGMLVEDLRIRRAPIGSAINGALELVTAGQWEQAKAKYGYDKLFHLSLIVNSSVVVEKNAVVNVGPVDRVDGAEYYSVNLQGTTTLNDLLENCRKGMGDAAYFSYDAFKNNCQVLRDLLRVNELLTSGAQAFLFQDVGELMSELPGITPKVAKAVTTLGALFDVALYGK